MSSARSNSYLSIAHDRDPVVLSQQMSCESNFSTAHDCDPYHRVINHATCSK